MTSPYDVLGVSPDADIEEIHRAYLALARRHHPDAGGDPAEMRRINDAWALLSDRRRRRRLDAAARPASPPPTFDDAAGDERAFDPEVDLHRRRPATPRQRMIDTVTLLAVMVCGASAAVSFLFGMMLESGPLMGFCVFSLFLTAIFVVARTLLAMRFDAGTP